MARRNRYESPVSAQLPPGSIKLQQEAPKKSMIKFVLFMIWQTILHGRNRR